MSCINRASVLVSTKILLFVITATISCVYLLSYVSMINQSESWSLVQVYVSKLSVTKYFTNVTNGNETSRTPEGTTNLFEAGTSKEHDIVQRTIAQLNMMTHYGATSRTRNRTVKVILRVGGFNWEDWVEGDQKFVQNECPVKECFLTSDTENKKLTADALIISQIDSNSVKQYLPKPSHQIWVVRHLESPLHNRIDPSSLKGLVNWTFTYRAGSTVPNQYFAHFLPTNSVDSRYYFRENPYFMRIPQPFGASHSTINYARGKHKKVAWFVSNCGGRNGRGAYAEQLARYIDVDIYGGCGKHNCVKDNAGCRKMLKDDYKFYLGFENSNCIGYITEKPSYQALLSDTIPIVMGARPEDYKSLLPPDSYIHVDDFQSPKHLAEYLKIVDNNDTLYNSYFLWKDSWMPILDSNTGHYCRLCFLLHYRDDVNYFNTIADYSDWWNGACSAQNSEYGSWQTWRPTGFWSKLNATSVHKAPSI